MVIATVAWLGGANAGAATPLARGSLEAAGHGPVVVLESGLGGANGEWQQVARALEPCLTVAIDRRPEPETSRLVLAATVADGLLARLRACVLPGPYILVGHPLGGLYVQAVARNHPDAIAGLVLLDATSPLEPAGVFVSTMPPTPGSVDAAEEAGVAPSIAALLAGPKLPDVPLIIVAATRHDDTQAREALWRDVQRRTAALSPKGRSNWSTAAFSSRPTGRRS